MYQDLYFVLNRSLNNTWGGCALNILMFLDGFLPQSAEGINHVRTHLDEVVNWNQVVAKYAAMQGLREGPIFSAHQVEEVGDDIHLDTVNTADEKATNDPSAPT